MYNVYFENIPQIGILYLEKELFSFENIPIVFVCVDKKNNRYLCICDDVIEEESWIIVQISDHELLDVIKDNTTVLSAFKDKNLITASRKMGGTTTYTLTNYKDMNPDDLPLKDQYLEMSDYLSDYVNKLSSNHLTVEVILPDQLSRQTVFEYFDLNLKTVHEYSRGERYKLYEQQFERILMYGKALLDIGQLHEIEEYYDMEKWDADNTLKYAA